MKVHTFRNFTKTEDLYNSLIDEGAAPQFVFHDTIPQEELQNLKSGLIEIQTGCGCAGYVVDYINNVITFTVNAPTVPFTMKTHYLKEVSPYLQLTNGDRIVWEIKFFVRNKTQ